MLVQPVEGAVEHHLCCQQLISGVNLTGSPALQGDDALSINHAQLAQDLRPTPAVTRLQAYLRERADDL